MESGYTYPGRSLNTGEVIRNQSYCINPDSDVGLSLKKSADVIVLLDTSSEKDGRPHKNRKDGMLKKMNDYKVIKKTKTAEPRKRTTYLRISRNAESKR